MPSPSGRRDHFLALPAFQRADLEGRVRVEWRSIAEHMTIVSKGSIATQRASSQQLHLRAESGPSPGDPSRRANRPEAEVPTCLPNRHRDAKQLVRAAMEFALFDLETPHRVRKRRSFTKTRRRR